jgi:hypothetical protein
MADYAFLRQFQEYLPPHNPTFANPAFVDAPYRVLIARLSPFRDVDRSIPHLFLFQEARRALPDAYIDLAFLPTERARAEFTHHGVPYLIGTQSLCSVDEFDLVLISNAYTLELINLPYLFIHSQIPLYASQRGPEWPLFLLGGSNALATQSVVREDGDSLVDGIFFGEGDGCVAEILSALASSAHKRKSSKQALQRIAANVDGLWVSGPQALDASLDASLDAQVTIKAICTPDAEHLATAYPLLNSDEAHTASLQINYGCPAFCSFCFEGYDRKPYREIPLHDLLAAARRLKREQGAQEVSLYSFNANTYAQLLPLLLQLHRLFQRVSLKSQRVDILQHAGYLLDAQVIADKRSFTLGIEGISERQRAWLHKSLPTGDITGLIERLLSAKIREVKLFYMLTGHETEKDVAEFRAFVRQVKAIRRARNPGIRVVFSFGLLIRMPFTPLRYDRLFLEEGPWRPLIGKCKSACETNGFEFRLAFDWPTYCVTQVLALGGYWLADAVIELAQQGCCFDTTLPGGYWDQLRGWMVRTGHWNEAFLGEKGPGYPFALGFVQSGISDDFLYQQYQDARGGVDSGYCLGSQDQRGRCLACGACTSAEQRKAITRHQMDQPEAGPYLARLRETVVQKRHLQPLYVLCRVGGISPGIQPALLNALVLRGLLTRHPDLVDNLLAARESLFTVAPSTRRRRAPKRPRYTTMSGETVFALYAWDVDALLRALEVGPSQRRLVTSLALKDAHSSDLAAAGAIEVLQVVEEFVPGVFTSLRLHLYLPAAVFESPRQHLEQYLAGAYVPYSLRREEAAVAGATRYRFDVPAKGLKKKVLLAGHFEIDEGSLSACLEVGPRFDLLALLDCFGVSGSIHYAKLESTDVCY